MQLKPPPGPAKIILGPDRGFRGRGSLPSGFGILSLSLLFIFAFSLSFSSVAAQAPQVSRVPKAPLLFSSIKLSRAGYFQLRCIGGGREEEFYELQESASPEFTDAATLYRGGDLGTFISGRRNGLYYYRLRGGPEIGNVSPWSETVSVRVRHYDPEDSLFVLFLGFLVFFSTFLLIGLGHLRSLRAHRRSDPRF